VTEEIPTPSGTATRPSIRLISPTPYQGGETARYLPPTLVKIPVAIPGTDAVTWVLQFHTPVDESATLGYWCTSRRVASDEARDQWLAQQEMFAALWAPVDAQDVRMCEALREQQRRDFRLLPQDGGITRVKHLLSHLARTDR
jgi:hypothetical protein